MRTHFAMILVVGLVGPGAATAEEGQGGRPPNVLLITANDLGYADVGFHGCRDIPTPHLDALARSGVRFTDGYVSSPACSPTRAGLMSGRYPQCFGFGDTGFLAPGQFLLESEASLAELLKAAGYATGLYDLEVDIAESDDRSAAHPELVEKLSRLHAEWASEMPPPRRRESSRG